MPPDALLQHFESLGDDGPGDDCEFGLVQRAAGHEPLGLLRFASIPHAGLHDLLEAGMERVGEPDDTFLVRDERDEILVQLPSFGMRYHTHIHGRRGHEPAILADQLRRIPFLRRKLEQDLAEASKIFVRKALADTATMQALLAVLRKRGPATLLWVTQGDGTQPIGTVEVLADGLLRGTVDRSVRFDGQPDINIAAWLEICRGARLLKLIQAPQGTVRPPPQPIMAPNLLPATEAFGDGWWRREAVADSAISTAVPPPRPEVAVMAHRLQTTTEWPIAAIFGRYVPEGLVERAPYVASLDVWIPADFTGTMVGMVFDGFASGHTANADLQARACWQRIWVQARIPEEMSAGNPSLCVLGETGAVLYTACWKLEAGVVPTGYRPA